jgi:hypothetical protein
VTVVAAAAKMHDFGRYGNADGFFGHDRTRRLL